MNPLPPETASRRSARAIPLASVSPDTELALVAGMARHRGASALVIASPTGDVARIGRHQRPGRSGAARELRRSTGGRSTRGGDGVVSLSALAPDPEAWLDDTATLSGPRLLNRLVRGLLSGLGKLGLAASYPGRDFVVANGRRVASVSIGRETSGVVVFQSVLAVDAPYTTAEPEPVWPGLPPAPEASWLARELGRTLDFATIAHALTTGFAERFALTLDATALSNEARATLERGSPPQLADATLEGLACTGPIAIPIGELDVYTALDPDGRLARIRFGGDWMAAESPLLAFESALAGEAPGSARVLELCRAWLAHPESLVVGLTDATALADAIARSARA